MSFEAAGQIKHGIALGGMGTESGYARLWGRPSMNSMETMSYTNHRQEAPVLQACRPHHAAFLLLTVGLKAPSVLQEWVPPLHPCSRSLSAHTNHWVDTRIVALTRVAASPNRENSKISPEINVASYNTMFVVLSWGLLPLTSSRFDGDLSSPRLKQLWQETLKWRCSRHSDWLRAGTIACSCR